MNTYSLQHPTVRFLVRHYVEVLTALALLFILQAGLIPFDFASQPPPGASRVFFDARVFDLALPDIISNIFLYLPLGVLLHWSLCRAVASRTLAILVTIGLAAALSAGIEYLQAYSSWRVSSLLDLVSNILGAGLGASISWVARLVGPQVIGSALHEFHVRPQAAILKTYCVVLVIFAAIPFSFSFDVARLKKSVKSANFVPFAATAIPDELTGDLRQKDGYWHYAYSKWFRAKRWSRWAAECASFVVLVWLMHPLLRGYYGFRRRAVTILVWWLCGVLAIGLSVLQLPIVTRACDVTDVLFRLLGVWLGLATRSIYLGESASLTADLLSARWRRLARIGCAATVVYIVYTGVIPLLFGRQAGGPIASLSSSAFLPFFAYSSARFDLMMNDLMEKFVSYAVLAALLATCWSRVIGASGKARMMPIMGVCVALSAALEIVQMFIPVRVISLTDPILAACACVVGVIAQEHAVSFYTYALSHQPVGPGGMRQPARRDAYEPYEALSLTDELIATLSEPSEQAPTEPSPSQTPTRHR